MHTEVMVKENILITTLNLLNLRRLLYTLKQEIRIIQLIVLYLKIDVFYLYIRERPDLYE
jgi:hypothetical protein